MKIFSKHRRKLEPSRRFGGRAFQTKIKEAQNYKRIFHAPTGNRMEKFWRSIGFTSKLWRRLGILGVIIIFYFLVISQQFIISDFQITGNAQVQSQTIEDTLNQEAGKRIFLIKKSNFFLLSKGRVNEILTSKIPTIKEVTDYDRQWPKTAKITIKERTPGFALKSNNNYFLIDDEGTVVKPLDNPGNLLVVEDSLVEDFGSGEAFPNPKMAPFILSMNRAWPAKFNTGIVSVMFPGKASNDVQFNSTEGWSVMFDINRSVALQLTNLNILLSQQIAAKDRPNLAYIDLRSAKWAYYCFKGTACEQKAQNEELTGETQTNEEE